MSKSSARNENHDHHCNRWLLHRQSRPRRLWIRRRDRTGPRSEEHTSELQSLMRNSYAVFCLKKKKKPELKVSIILKYQINTIMHISNIKIHENKTLKKLI